MTPEQQAAEHPDLAERQTRMSQVINGASEAPRTRKRRSDADKPREKARPKATGTITVEQFKRINLLYGQVGSARLELHDCEEARLKAAKVFRDAEADYFNYLDEITAK